MGQWRAAMRSVADAFGNDSALRDACREIASTSEGVCRWLRTNPCSDASLGQAWSDAIGAIEESSELILASDEDMCDLNQSSVAERVRELQDASARSMLQAFDRYEKLTSDANRPQT